MLKTSFIAVIRWGVVETQTEVRRGIKPQIHSHSYRETRQICPVWNEHLSSFGIWRVLYLLESVFPLTAFQSAEVFFSFISSHFSLPAPLVSIFLSHPTFSFLVVSLCLWDNSVTNWMYLVIYRPKTIAPDSSGLTATVTFSH